MSIKVDQALIQSFISAAFGLPVAHENIDYTPTVGTAYAEITVFDSGTEALDLSHTNERIGLFQCVLRYPINTGAVAAKTKAEAIFNRFEIGSKHTYSGQDVWITAHDRQPGYPENGWYKIVMRMRYRAFITR